MSYILLDFNDRDRAYLDVISLHDLGYPVVTLVRPGISLYIQHENENKFEVLENV